MTISRSYFLREVHAENGSSIEIEAAARLVEDLRLVTVDGGPHNICWTDPEEVNTALLEFFAAERGASPQGAQEAEGRSIDPGRVRPDDRVRPSSNTERRHQFDCAKAGSCTCSR
jgi:hypothetical protein